GQALLQRGALVRGEWIGLAERDLLRVVLVATPDAEAADEQRVAIGLRELVKQVPAALLAIALHLAADHAPDFQGAAIEDEAEGCQLANDVIVIRRHFSNSPAH